MEKADHGRRLAAAMAAQRMDRAAVAEVLDVDVRTITNWTSGATMPKPAQRAILRELLGDYDNPGDPVEVAVRNSNLVEWRQDAVISDYKRHRYEQSREEVSEGTPNLSLVAKEGGIEEPGEFNT